MYLTEEKRREEYAVKAHRHNQHGQRRAGMTEQERAADDAAINAEREEWQACRQKGIPPIAPGYSGPPGLSDEDTNRGRLFWHSLRHPLDSNSFLAEPYREAYRRGAYAQPAPEQVKQADTKPAPGVSIFIR